MGHVRDQVAAREGIAAEHQRLMYAGKQLVKGDHTLEDYGVTEKCTLHLLGRVRGGMPEASWDDSSRSKRPRLVFEDPMDIEAAGLDPLCAQWKVWLETCAPIATAFLPPEAKAAEALGYRERATRQGLTEAGVQEMVHWAAPGKPDHEVLLALAVYEKAKPYKVDLLQGKWVEAPKPPQGQPQDQPQNAPEVDPVQKEIADLEAKIAKLRMPKIPLSIGYAQRSSSRPSATRRCRPGWRGTWWRHCRHMGRHRWRERRMRRRRERYCARRYGLPCT